MNRSTAITLNSIDLAKFFMAIMVVAIHTIRPENVLFSNIFSNVTGLAVPFFFISSAFLLHLKVSNEEQSIKEATIIKFIKRMIRLYLMWSILYLPFSFYGIIVKKTSLVTSIFLYFWNLFFNGEHYYSWPLWYLLGTIYAAVLLYFILRKNLSIKFVLIVSLILFVIGQTIILVSQSDFLIEGTLIYKGFRLIGGTGRLLAGMSYFLFGYFVAENGKKIRGVYSLLLLLLLLLIGIVCYQRMVWYYLNLPLSYFLFEFVLSINLSQRFLFLRKSSTVMYFTHMIFFFAYSYLCGVEFQYGFVGFIVSVLCTIILSIIVYHRKGKVTKLLFG